MSKKTMKSIIYIAKTEKRKDTSEKRTERESLSKEA